MSSPGPASCSLGHRYHTMSLLPPGVFKAWEKMNFKDLVVVRLVWLSG